MNLPNSIVFKSICISTFNSKYFSQSVLIFFNRQIYTVYFSLAELRLSELCLIFSPLSISQRDLHTFIPFDLPSKELLKAYLGFSMDMKRTM